ncbi:hypothetical protein DFH06DRAFT_1205787 [Mycena polygramma]|nr:hypothetical protein DFH06DRAFT_1205787 [Mycena polygramma]
MSTSLPDEIISEILSPALKVSEEMFSDTSRTSPFASSSVSTSAALVVCKAWLRVATPLLYHVVVLRSKAQARALQHTLHGNPDLGRFIKMLRVEGGFGPAMQEILKNSPNISDLFLSLEIHAPDSTGGLVSGLSSINPTRMIIFDHPRKQLKNKQVLGLVEALETCAPKWTNFSTVNFAYYDIYQSQRLSFIKNICACPTLRALSFPDVEDWDVPTLIEISRLPSLETIEIRSEATDVDDDAIAAISEDPRLHSLVHWLDEPKITKQKNEPVSLRPSDPSFRPMASAPQEVVERVWSRCLEFATLSSQADSNVAATFLSMSPPKTGLYHDRLQFLLVSKMFHRLAIPYLYRHLAFPRWGPLCGLSLRLASTPAVGMHVRSIAIRQDPLLLEDKIDLSAIFTRTPQLARLVGHKGLFSVSPTLDWTMFEALGLAAGASLQELSGFKLEVAGGGVPHSPAVFGHFPVLRSLDWTVDHRHLPYGPFFDRAAVVPTDGLPVLESLRVGYAAGLELFVGMDLPSLRRVDLDLEAYRDPAFLQKHGAKLEELKLKETDFRGTSILTLCPRISTLSCTVHPQSGSDLGCNRLAPGFQHTCLTTLIMDKEALSNKVKDADDWKLFFDRLDLTQFPLLKEIRVMAIHEWPTTEHAISKNMWVKLTEKLLPRGIQLTNMAGARWHPRLKASRSRR